MQKSHAVTLASVIGVIIVAVIIVLNLPSEGKESEQGTFELVDQPNATGDSVASTNAPTDTSRSNDTASYNDMFIQLNMNGDSVASNGNTPSQPNTSNNYNTYPIPEVGPTPPSDSAATIVAGNDVVKKANRGILIVGSAPNVRALEPHSGSTSLCNGYAQVANEIKSALGSVNVYCMIIPTAVAFYCPASEKGRMTSQSATIQEAYRHLNNVKGVNIYNPLSHHVNEDIYLRTDHHWAPLGGYYAAQELARVAGVPFRDISSYDRHVVKGYVGSMYGFSKDISVKQSPEDFVYYTPRNVSYTTTYVNYRATSAQAGTKGNYFFSYPDGSGGAYCTFMGGDAKITQVRTGNNNGRRIAILKDSFGNTIPGYLFYSFEEVHVIDYRYFNRNLKDYVNENKITDVCIANNIKATLSAIKAYRKFIK